MGGRIPVETRFQVVPMMLMNCVSLTYYGIVFESRSRLMGCWLIECLDNGLAARNRLCSVTPAQSAISRPLRLARELRDKTS